MKVEETSLSRSEVRWLACYVAASWLSNIGHGLVVTVVGPTQPYIAKNVGVGLDTINLLWSFGFFGFAVGAVAAGFVFRRYCKSAAQKTTFLCLTMMISGIIMITLPFLRNFGLLVTARCLQNVALGAFITADCSLVVYTMGPIRSRPFTMTVHAVIGAGFLAGTFLVKPFLPKDDSSSLSREDVCQGSGSSDDKNALFNSTVHTTESPEKDDLLATTKDDHDLLFGIEKIAWPFIISGAWCVFFSLGYGILVMLPFDMPRYYVNDNSISEDEPKESNVIKIRLWKHLLLFTFFYYLISCGIERIYQPMAYTYGLCGPLKLSPAEAVIIDQSYNGGFMVGRFVSIFVAAKVLRPRNMILASLLTCVASAIVLVVIGGETKYGLYVGTGCLGLFVSWQYGSCYSWVAQKGDISGRPASIFFIGCGSGGLIFPPLAGFIFTSSWWGPQVTGCQTFLSC